MTGAESTTSLAKKKEDLKRLLRRREKLHSSKDSQLTTDKNSESEFRAVRLSPKAHVLYCSIASPVDVVFRKRKSTAKPNDSRQKSGSRELSVDAKLSCFQSVNVFEFSLES